MYRMSLHFRVYKNNYAQMYYNQVLYYGGSEKLSQGFVFKHILTATWGKIDTQQSYNSWEGTTFSA